MQTEDPLDPLFLLTGLNVGGLIVFVCLIVFVLTKFVRHAIILHCFISV